MLVNTKEAADILGVSQARVRLLLQQGRIEGAYKIGKFWVIPLYDDRPFVKTGSRGPKPKWSNPRRPAQTDIKIDRHKIKKNTQQPLTQIEPTISVSKRGKTYFCHELEIQGPCRVCYSLEPQKSKGGARVWIETRSPVKMFAKDFQNTTTTKEFIGLV